MERQKWKQSPLKKILEMFLATDMGLVRRQANAELGGHNLALFRGGK